MRNKRIHALLAALLLLAALAGCAEASGETALPPSKGTIYLYGEQHGVDAILDKELELWRAHYENDGMRHLFVELPYYTAEFLNLWMRAENDDILDAVYADWAGTASYTEGSKAFYAAIKESCPETVFHGTDVGHQHATTGQRYLDHLKSGGQEGSEAYRLAEAAIAQGKRYYRNTKGAYRENTMTANFIRAFDALGGESVMGIYGTAHTYLHAKDYASRSVPCMAAQLAARYGDAVRSEDLSELIKDIAPLRTDTITLGGKDYAAPYFGKQDLRSVLKGYTCREFWRLEGAYADFQDARKTGDVLPYDNYPMRVERGQVYVIDYTTAAGEVIRKYYRSDGNEWEGRETTEEFAP